MVTLWWTILAKTREFEKREGWWCKQEEPFKKLEEKLARNSVFSNVFDALCKKRIMEVSGVGGA